MSICRFLGLNAQKSRKRTKFWRTHGNLDINSPKFVKWTKFWCTDKSLSVNCLWTNENVVMSARKSGDCTKAWSLDIKSFCRGWSGHNVFPSEMVWTSGLSIWDGLDTRSFHLGWSGHQAFPSGVVWTYLIPSRTSTWVPYCATQAVIQIRFGARVCNHSGSLTRKYIPGAGPK